MSKPAEAPSPDPLAQLIQKKQFVGWLCHVDYEQALVLTRDDWKASARGVPQNCFLIAAPVESCLDSSLKIVTSLLLVAPPIKWSI